ncbi:bacterial luciferase-like protein [Hyaloscypha bicolor E]|uniref:Bacterial luciferase-like protein n=1 Tax=Hyaloscypha bicolor E TaxID=1095630 RepID=A0A2J6T4A7_9HELO|nr:bacterial luciferase-like protein [Hyaloscypha bicolor E]PMD57861.1 bacterial luciferase-like protein [Hyaloscypha bicolor E]
MADSKGSKPPQLHLTAFMRPANLHTGAWRYPGAYPDANFNFDHIKSFIQKLEAAKFDAFFMADHLAVLNMPVEALKRSHTVTSFEPFTLLSALSVVTEKIGLAATASTTYDEPYHIARRFASLDHLSNGRAAWNIVTTGNPESAKNFGREDHVEHGSRYKRAREFCDVVTGLWDSFADDAFIRDQERGIFFDPEKMHVLNHKGDDLNVKGPLLLTGIGLISRFCQLLLSSLVTHSRMLKPNGSSWTAWYIMTVRLHLC